MTVLFISLILKLRYLADLQYARLNYSSQMFWPLTDSRNWVIALSTNLGYGIGYGESKELPFLITFLPAV